MGVGWLRRPLSDSERVYKRIYKGDRLGWGLGVVSLADPLTEP